MQTGIPSLLGKYNKRFSYSRLRFFVGSLDDKFEKNFGSYWSIGCAAAANHRSKSICAFSRSFVANVPSGSLLEVSGS